MYRFWFVCVLSTGVGIVTPCQEKPADDQAEVDDALDWLQTRLVGMRSDLDAARRLLEARARRDAPELVAKLSPPLPEPRPDGYGLLPDILPDLPLQPVALYRYEFSIPLLTTRAAPDWRDGFVLRRRADHASLPELVAEFERLRGRLTYIEGQIAYHRYWQKAVSEHANYFANRNRIMRDAEKLLALVNASGEKSEADAKEIARLRRLIEAKIAPFQKTPGLKIEAGEDGARILRVRVVTDIEDDAFLEVFRRAVAQEFGGSPAVQAAKFRIELTIEKVAPARLYDGAPPERGAPIEEKAHVARFPEGQLVLTTGAKSTHSFVGRYIQLGTKAMRPRELAHEFCHLLGFSDAYLRGFTGTSGGKTGCTVVEWGGLQDNLMGSPARGAVTRGMIELLLDAY